jgi:hypothetical protein
MTFVPQQRPKPVRNYAVISVDVLSSLDYNQLSTTSQATALTNAAENQAIISWLDDTPTTLISVAYTPKTHDEIITLLQTAEWTKEGY